MRCTNTLDLSVDISAHIKKQRSPIFTFNMPGILAIPAFLGKVVECELWSALQFPLCNFGRRLQTNFFEASKTKCTNLPLSSRNWLPEHVHSSVPRKYIFHLARFCPIVSKVGDEKLIVPNEYILNGYLVRIYNNTNNKTHHNQNRSSCAFIHIPISGPMAVVWAVGHFFLQPKQPILTQPSQHRLPRKGGAAIRAP